MEPTGRRRGPLGALGTYAHQHHRIVLVVAAILTFVAAIVGADVTDKLVNGGYTPEESESARAERILSTEFDNGTPNLLLVAEADRPIGTAEVAAAGLALHERVASSDGVGWVRSFWADRDPRLRSGNGDSALLAVHLTGSEHQAQKAAQELVPVWERTTPLLTLRATGEAKVNAEVAHLSEQDLVTAELIAAPITALILLWVFRTVLAALLPVLVGAVAVSLNLALLSGLASLTSVSQFALNVTTALGFGLAVDYSLFVVTRYREELERGRGYGQAVVTSVTTAGRTVLFSVITVAVSLSALLLFPLTFLRSLAYAAIPVTLLAGLVSVTVLPALLFLCGRHLERFRLPLGKRSRRDSTNSPGWRRWARLVMRRPLIAAVPVTLLLLLLAAPFTQVRFGLTDYRVLPADSPGHQAASTIEREFPWVFQTDLQVVVRHPDGDRPPTAGYAASLSTLPRVTGVQGPTGVYQDGVNVRSAPAPDPARTTTDASWLTVLSSVNQYSPAAEELVRDVRATEAPSQVLVAGNSAVLVDTKAVLAERIPWAAGVIVVSTFVLLFLFTGSVLIPVKALVLNLLSLTATFGAMVYVFQEGHLQWLVGDFTPTGYLEITIPVLMFCIAFGLSMDYEVFLLGRIREEYDHHADNTHAVAFGLEKTGRLFTAAALVVAVVLGALATSGLSLLKLLGVGLALAVLTDAVLIRGVLVPAFMRIAGAANWWMPGFLKPVYRTFALKEGDGPPPEVDVESASRTSADSVHPS